ncbi:UNVERIFIED_CONTAM: Copper transport protein ATX1 [Sesamum radiatum]|uniref:Copper transport protein ATX1 n=1 Tax=Sesamum radiatum TaxID=300843 RepID=A0AAW2KBU0_SESRA
MLASCTSSAIHLLSTRKSLTFSLWYFCWAGVKTFDIDLEKQKVTVKGNVQPEAVLQTVSKTGKATSYWEATEAPAAAAEAPAAAESKPAETVAAA